MPFIDQNRPLVMEGTVVEGTVVDTIKRIRTARDRHCRAQCCGQHGALWCAVPVNLTFFGHPAHKRSPCDHRVVLRLHSRHQTLVLALINQ